MNKGDQGPPRILTYKIIKTNDMNPETIERIEGLINLRDLDLFKNALENITNDLEQEGFELSDVKAYFKLVLNEILGDQ